MGAALLRMAERSVALMPAKPEMVVAEEVGRSLEQYKFVQTLRPEYPAATEERVEEARLKAPRNYLNSTASHQSECSCGSSILSERQLVRELLVSEEVVEEAHSTVLRSCPSIRSRAGMVLAFFGRSFAVGRCFGGRVD